MTVYIKNEISASISFKLVIGDFKLVESHKRFF